LSSPTHPEFLTGDAIIAAGRSPEAPFRLALSSAGEDSELTCAQVVRSLPGRRLVCYGAWRGRSVVAKLFLDRSRSSGHCARERLRAEALAADRVPTPALLLEARAAGSHVEVLLFERIPEAAGFRGAWEAARGDDERWSLLEKGASLIAILHRAGLKQDDPHLGNFLCAAGKLYVIDADTVDLRRRGRPLPRRTSLRNVAYFLAQFSCRHDRLITRALHVYAERRGWSLGEADLPEVQRSILRYRARLRARLLKRIYRESSLFVCRRDRCRYQVYCRASDSAPLRALLDDPERAMELGDALGDGGASTRALVDVAGRRLLLRRYSSAGWRRLRPSGARIAWRNGYLLAFHDIPAPRPVALLERRPGPLRFESYLLAEHVGGVPVQEYFRGAAADAVPATERDAAARALVDVLEELAQNRLRHRNLRAAGFVVASGRVWLTDLDALEPVRSERRLRRSFARDIERFLGSWEDAELRARFGRLLEPLLARFSA
jgi:hypothetical protein